jgi:biopolymer transport protein ExbB/TolQ
VILPSDAREYLRTLEQMPPKERDSVVPRVLAAALKRFSATGNVQDASQTVHNVCESENNRLDAELAILRFSVWVTPALGFVGTVRGIGLALQGAELAVKGDTSAVTSGLGISFNSTLVALTLSIFLMYILHEIQLAQERLVLDAENYADEELISRLHSV